MPGFGDAWGGTNPSRGGAADEPWGAGKLRPRGMYTKGIAGGEGMERRHVTNEWD